MIRFSKILGRNLGFIQILNIELIIETKSKLPGDAKDKF